LSHTDDIRRITEGLRAAAEAVAPFTPGAVAFETKDERGDPLTATDLAADRVLREILPRDGEGWLSEESADDGSTVTKQVSSAAPTTPTKSAYGPLWTGPATPTSQASAPPSAWAMSTSPASTSPTRTGRTSWSRCGRSTCGERREG
jgi:type II secretory pathway pseudopilin PulG